jgi:hypothetical protein
MTLSKTCCLPSSRGLTLFTQLPSTGILRHLHSYTRIPIRYWGVGKRACSPGFLERLSAKRFEQNLDRDLAGIQRRDDPKKWRVGLSRDHAIVVSKAFRTVSLLDFGHLRAKG